MFGDASDSVHAGGIANEDIDADRQFVIDNQDLDADRQFVIDDEGLDADPQFVIDDEDVDADQQFVIDDEDGDGNPHPMPTRSLSLMTRMAMPTSQVGSNDGSGSEHSEWAVSDVEASEDDDGQTPTKLRPPKTSSQTSTEPSVYGGHPPKRTRTEKALAGARMREGKARKLCFDLHRESAEALAAYTERMNSSNALINAELRVAQRRKGGRASRSAYFGLDLVARGSKGQRAGAKIVLSFFSISTSPSWAP